MLELAPHPEGGFYKETYRSAETMSRAGDTRNVSTAIYFLLPKGARSLFHRIKSDEAWHFYLGGPLTIVQIAPTGRIETVTLGQNIALGEQLQHVVPAGCWFGALPSSEHDYSLVGCTVAPGFDFADFEIARREELMARYPLAARWILKLTE